MKTIMGSPRAMVKHTLNPHLVSQNACQTEPAKLLVFLLSQEGESIKAPIK